MCTRFRKPLLYPLSYGGASAGYPVPYSALTDRGYWWSVLRLVLASVSALVGLAGSAQAATTPSPTRGVVLITTDLALQNAKAAGTGIVLTSGGKILTNNHVIRGATTITVIVPATQRRCTATVRGYDVQDDVALLKANGCGTLATATRGNSSQVRVGQFARAVGNANGAGRLVVTTGTITGVNRSIAVGDDDGSAKRLTGLLQTSARLVPGVSGGPLLNAAGRVIGIDTAGSPNWQFRASDGYAIPINRAMAIVQQIDAGRQSATVHIGKTAFIGISASDVQGGVEIENVVPGSAAESAGLQRGDIVTALDGTAVSSLETLRGFLFPLHPGDVVTITYVDALGATQTVELTLGEGPPQ